MPPTTSAATAHSSIRQRAMDAVRTIVLDRLEGLKANVWLFGSCARGDAWHSSDIDVAIEPTGTLPRDFFGALREALEESNVPYHVDVVDLSHATTSLREAVERDGIRWR